MAIQDARTLLALSLIFANACKGSPASGGGPTADESDAASQRSGSGEVDELMSATQLLGVYADNAGHAPMPRSKGNASASGARPPTSRATRRGFCRSPWGRPQDPTDLACNASLPISQRATRGQGFNTGADITVDGTCAGLGTNVTLRDCKVPRCAMPVCEALRAGGVADECKAATKDWSDSATFRMPSVMSDSGFGGGYVECEPSDKVYYFMVNDLRSHARPNQLVLASPKARVVVSLASDDPIPHEIEAKTRALVEAL